MLQYSEMYAGSRAFCSIYLVGTSARGSATVEAFLWVVLALSNGLVGWVNFFLASF